MLLLNNNMSAHREESEGPWSLLGIRFDFKVCIFSMLLCTTLRMS
ncbi:unnamed protein product [Acanthoscelides obtectus]|uniref:Uncharacterized protein n=1 Tax=Acanthoscelides obtectus TaxID=200917 RepID=A0A9P0MJN5_ACAOB|nr:unnamed protein product [Acanthoscelides obtectus]CAK1622351.1 hypothetical protein AOBTE_LOCUS1441 [Acanthoscelides obtectus]